MMTNDFKSWRRKLGLMTLAMACLVMVAWVRGIVIRDYVELPMQLGISTDGRSLSLVNRRDMGFVDWNDRQQLSPYRVMNNVELIPLYVIPFWPLTVPLILLSSYLLLSKPRQPIQANE